MQVKVYFGVPYNDSSWKVVADSLEQAMKRNPVIDVVRGDGRWFPTDMSSRIELWWGQPHLWNFDGRSRYPRIGMTLSEGDRLPKDKEFEYITKCNQCDLLLFASRAAAYPFKISPINVPMFLLPLGVEQRSFNFYERDFNTPEFTFLHYGVTQVRKGSDLVLEAFRRVVSEFKYTKLIVHHWTTWDEPFGLLRDKYKDISNVEWDYFTSGVGETADVVKLLSRAHCLVAPSLTEGWGMCITEAMATGMPVITTRASAMLDYFSEEFGWWIELGDDYVPLSLIFPNTPGYIRLPSVDSLVEKMRYAIVDRITCSIKGKAACRYITNSLTWDVMVKRLVPIFITLQTGNVGSFVEMSNRPGEYYYHSYVV